MTLEKHNEKQEIIFIDLDDHRPYVLICIYISAKNVTHQVVLFLPRFMEINLLRHGRGDGHAHDMIMPFFFYYYYYYHYYLLNTILPYPFFFFLLKIIISVIVLAMYRFVVTNLKEGWASVTWSCYVIFISCQNSKYFDLS